jgi:hypothetical protein
MIMGCGYNRPVWIGYPDIGACEAMGSFSMEVNVE